MKLPKLQDLKVGGKIVLVRVDLDMPLVDVENKQDRTHEFKVLDDSRLRTAIPTIKLLLDKGAEHVLIMGHIGKLKVSSFCLYPVLNKLLGERMSFWGEETINSGKRFKADPTEDGRVHLMENLRLFEGEEENDPVFAKKLASLGDIYINESFADSHRAHASIVGLPKLLPHAAGLHLMEEIENLSKVLEKPKSPVVFIIGGAKSDKVQYIDKLLDRVDWVLVGGLLPRMVESYCRDDNKICVIAAKLTPEGKDIDEASSTNFAAICANAGTIAWNGPLGQYEEAEFKRGTEVVAQAVAESEAFKVVGGGDTIACLQNLGILSKMNWVSTGGGAMLQFLAEGDLPGLKALRN
ncbi:phosphoglycerate kinase [Candidatus Microgenomates bacterium]|nr:phosphoglycerate kinase [Candidatus Microgenomates bacterium]